MCLTLSVLSRHIVAHCHGLRINGLKRWQFLPITRADHLEPLCFQPFSPDHVPVTKERFELINVYMKYTPIDVSSDTLILVYDSLNSSDA